MTFTWRIQWESSSNRKCPSLCLRVVITGHWHCHCFIMHLPIDVIKVLLIRVTQAPYPFIFSFLNIIHTFSFVLSQIVVRMVFWQMRRSISLCAFGRLEKWESVSASGCASLMNDNAMNVLSPLSFIRHTAWFTDWRVLSIQSGLPPPLWILLPHYWGEIAPHKTSMKAMIKPFLN